MAEGVGWKRRVRLLRPATGEEPGIFAIIKGRQVSFYVFREVPCQIEGRGFALHRLGLGNLYHVRIGTPAECSCECLGFLSRGQCRHVLALRALMENGLLG